MTQPIIDTLRQAEQLHRQGDVDGALRCCADVLAQAPAHPSANFMAGVLLESQGESARALPHLRFAIAHQTDDPSLRDVLAGCLLNLGCVQEAVGHLRQIVEAQPHNNAARFNLGRALLDCREYADAERVLVVFVRDNPGDAEAYSHLGLARLGQRNPASAEPCFRAAIRLNPKDALTHLNLARALADQAMDEPARASFALSIRIDPKNAESRCLFGWFELDRDRVQVAQAHFQAAMGLNPDAPQAAAGLAATQLFRGRLDEASRTLQPFIEAQNVTPRLAVVYAQLCRSQDSGSRALVVVRRALQGALDRDQEASLRFAEAAILDAMQAPDAAFMAVKKANEITGFRYSSMEHSALVDQLIKVFDADFFARIAPPVEVAGDGVVIVGMPSSGVDIAARLLTINPAIHDAGSMDDIPTMARGLARFVRGDDIYPQNVVEMTSELLGQLSAARKQSLGRASTAAVVIDRNWMNFLHLGLIAMVTPGAKIIHCVRDPVDTCLSCYFRPFAAPRFAFSTDLSALAGFYRGYHRLMKHFERVLPLDILKVQYTDLVDAPETAAQSMMAFVGQPWNPTVHGTLSRESLGDGREWPVARSAERYAHRVGPLLGLARLG